MTPIWDNLSDKRRPRNEYADDVCAGRRGQDERSGSMKLKWQKEMKWLLLAVLAFLFLFERSDTLTVQDGYVRLCRRTWWFYKREVKSAEVSSIESVTHKHVYGGGVKGDSLVLKDKGGKIFYELLYRGFVEFTTWKRAHNDQKACKQK